MRLRALLKGPKILIFDEATSNFDPVTAEHFAATINQLKGRATILFIAHALPKNLQIDEGVRLGTGTLSTVGAPHERISEAKPQEREAQLCVFRPNPATDSGAKLPPVPA